MKERKIILAVDDMPESLTLLRSILKDYFDIRVAKSAKMALGLLNNLQVALILLDIEMPGMSGFEFLRQVNVKDSLNKDTPVIFVTSHADKKFISQALDNGAKGYLLKPIKADALYKKIDAVIGMPENKNSLLEKKLNSLMVAAASGDSGQVESLAKELLVITKGQEAHIHSTMEDIAKLMLNFDYEKGIIKIKELLHNLSLKRKR